MSHRFVGRSSLGALGQGAPGFAALAGCGRAARRVLSRDRAYGSRDGPVSCATVPMAVKSGCPVGPAPAREAPWHHRPHKRARSLNDFPSLDEGDAFRRRSLLVSKTIANFARYPERRPAGVVPAGDGSLDIDQIWIFWGRRCGFSRSQLLQHIADHAIADSGRRRFLLHSDHDGRTWVSVAAPLRRRSRRRSQSKKYLRHVPVVPYALSLAGTHIKKQSAPTKCVDTSPSPSYPPRGLESKKVHGRGMLQNALCACFSTRLRQMGEVDSTYHVHVPVESVQS